MIEVGFPALRVLDFDIENRPLSYMGDDYTSGEVTAIAWQFVGEKTPKCVLLGQVSLKHMLEEFLDAYGQADIVTGHYIRKHDLPVISGALMEQGMEQLEPKLTHDTKLDLISHKYLSASQESLAEMLGVPYPKVHMTQPGWREANRLTAKGLQKTAARVVGDVKQHIEMRRRLLELGALGPPRIWRP